MSLKQKPWRFPSLVGTTAPMEGDSLSLWVNQSALLSVAQDASPSIIDNSIIVGNIQSVCKSLGEICQACEKTMLM